MTNIQEVARAAGVSTATVSRYVAGQTIRNGEAVRRAIDELGYSPSVVARSLKSGQHLCIGVVVPDITNPFFAAIVKGIEREARANGLQVILGNSDEDPGQEEALLADLALRTDGIIMAPLSEHEHLPVRVNAAGIPVVFVDRDIDSGLDVDRVMVDNTSGVHQAVEHLVGLDHTRIAVISGPLRSTPGRDRHEAFLDAMAGHGLTVDDELVEVRDFRESGGYDAMSRLWRADPRPTAIFIANNLMTMGALKALRDLGVAIPSALSVVGFDDLPLAALLDPPLTVVDRPEFDQGAEAGRLLIERLKGDRESAPHRVVLPVQLIVRNSTAPPPSEGKR